MATFDENGNYIKTDWKSGDKITAVKLNKIEESIEAVNNNDISRHVEVNARLDKLESGTTSDKQAMNAKIDALEDVVVANKDAADLEIYSINQHMTLLDKKIDDGVAEVEAIAETVDGKIAAAEVDMEDMVAEVEGLINYVTYEQFGVKSDGVYDDGIAIKAAHEYANAHNLKVIATGKTYYIKETVAIPIMTDTDFNGATFVIDDTLSVNRSHGVFTIKSRHLPITFTNPNFIINTTVRTIPELAGFGMCLVEVKNSNKKQYIRKGVNADTGYDQVDYFIIDNNGNILNDIIWDFEDITSVVLYPMDDSFLIVCNGNFITKPNNGPLESKYYERGIVINRSNTIIDNINHKLQDEQPGSPYNGFIHGSKCARILLKNCILQPHITYYRAADNVAMGNYDIRFDNVVELTLNNVVDRNFHTDRWGTYTMNNTKDVIVEKCKLIRVDAHMGIHNIQIRDCVLGHQGINLIGSGLCVIDNVNILGADAMITLRSDYGSTWDGDMYISNVRFICKNINYTPKLINFTNDGTHDFGYECRHPRKLVMTNIYVDDTDVDTSASFNNMYIVYNDEARTGVINNEQYKYPYYFSEYIECKNLKTASGRGFKVFYQDTLNLVRDKSYVYEEISVRAEDHKQLHIEGNTRMIIDDVELFNYTSGFGYRTSNIFGYTTNISADTDDYFVHKYRVLLDLTIKNCKNVFGYTDDTPMVFNLENCIINNLVNKDTSTRMIGSAKNCVFKPLLSGSASIVINPNWESFTFIDCYFDKPMKDDVYMADVNGMARAYGFLDFFKLENNAYFLARVKMVNCRIFDFDFKALSPLIEYCDFAFGNHNYEYHLCHRGYDGEKPNINDCPIPVGFIYYITSSNSFIIWNGTGWKTLTLE